MLREKNNERNASRIYKLKENNCNYNAAEHLQNIVKF